MHPTSLRSRKIVAILESEFGRQAVVYTGIERIIKIG
jgi:hypothetical protein